MLPDFTKEIILNEKYCKIYKILRAAIHLAALAAAFYFSFLVFFPSRYFTFSFLKPESSKNTIVNPRNEAGEFAERGKVSAGKNLIFDAPLARNFSKAIVSFSLSEKSAPFDFGTLQLRKSYQAFFYPEGNPVGFKDGTLLKDEENNHYLVSGGTLRKFKDASLVSALGFPKDAFVEAIKEDLKYNPSGEIISTSKNYPDFSLFRINDEYYILSGGKLAKFSSEQAFLTNYPANLAIPKEEDFLNNYPLDEENQIGFGNGTLIVYGDSVYVIENKNIIPIDSVETFEALGYDWNDLIPAGADEFSLYKKGKLLTIEGAHPDGTVLADAENGKSYLVENKTKRLLPTPAIARSRTRKNPVLVSSESLAISASCQLQKNKLSRRTFSCEIPLGDFEKLKGKDYEFSANFGQDIKLDAIDVEFEKAPSFSNLKVALSDIVNQIKANYAPKNSAR